MNFPKKPIARLSGHNGPVNCLTFSAGSGQYLLTGCSDRLIRLYNPSKAASGASSGVIKSFSAHGYEVLDVAVTHDNARFASVGGDRLVFLWDVVTGTTLRRYEGHTARCNVVDFGGEDASLVVSGSFDATVRIWDTRSQSHKPIQILSEAKDSVSALAVVKHEIMTGSVDGRVRVYDIRMGMVYVDVIGPPVTSLTPVTDASAMLITTLDSTHRLLDKASGKVLQSYTGHSNTEYRIRSCLGMNDAVAISGTESGGNESGQTGQPGEVIVWDVLNGDVLERLGGGDNASTQRSDRRGGSRSIVSAVAWNGRKTEWASARGDGTVTVWGMS